MALLRVVALTVSSLSVDFNEVRWAIEPTAADLLDFSFQVFRSEAALGPFEHISPEFEDQYLFIDNRIRIGHKYRQFHYKIRVKERATGHTEDFGPVERGAPPDLVAEEVRRRNNLLFKEFVGRRCWTLPCRTFGQRCSSCYNATLNQRTRSGCRLCFDTGFVRGYHSPIETWVQFDPGPKTEQPSSLGLTQQMNTTARLSYFPPLKPRDVIIEPENRRWRVTQVSATQRLRAVLHQEIQLHEIPSTDIEHLIDFDLGTHTLKTARGDELKAVSLSDLFLAGSRNFTNPQTVDTFKGFTDDLVVRVPR